MICRNCPRNCGAVRTQTGGAGFCGLPSSAGVCRAAPHFDEEPCISGTRGSGAIFFCGCVLRCEYCQNIEISRGFCGRTVSPEALSGMMQELEQSGVHNINLVSPTQYAHTVTEALKIRKPSVPVVYNCSGYERVETLRALDGLIDIYLPDYKYALPGPAEKYSLAADYPQTVVAAIGEMLRQTGPARIDADGLLSRGVMIRHLVLPKNRENSFAVLDSIAVRFGTDIPISLLAQYTPNGCETHAELARRITTLEYERVAEYARSLGFESGYTQQRDSANSRYIPSWDLIND